MQNKVKIQKLTLNRNGTFEVVKMSFNQCKATGHDRYKYTVKIECDTKLDKDDFVIDQLLIHSTIKSHIEGSRKMHSCERLCIVISEIVEKLCDKHSIEVYSIYTKVQALPLQRINTAFMELNVIFEDI